MVAGHDGNEALLTSYSLALGDKAESTKDAYVERLRRFAAGRDLLAVTRDELRAYLRSMEQRGRAKTTVRAHWIALKSFYKWAYKEREVATNLMDDVKVATPDPPPPAFPDDDDFHAVLKTCKGDDFTNRRDAAMLRFAAATGVRVSELLALNISDIDLRAGTAFVRHGKGDRARVVVYDGETARVLDRYLRMRARQRHGELDALWISRFGTLGLPGAQRLLERRCQAADVKPFSWHKLRHRYAHTYKSKGGSDDALMSMGGWTSSSVMRRYGSSLAAQRAADEYRRLGGVL